MIELLSADLYFSCHNKLRTLLMAWGRVSCIYETAFFPANCGADAPRFPPGGEGMRLIEP